MIRLYFIFIIFIIPINGYTSPKLFSSDWPVCALTEGMQEEGLLDDFSYRLEKYDICLKWFSAGNVDITFMTLYDFIAMQPTKEPTVIIGITDYSNGGDKLVVKNTIKNAKNLRSKKILLPSQTISLWFLNTYLKKNGLTIHDVEIIDQNENLGPLQFKEFSQYSAVVGWNPVINKALYEDSHIAATSTDFPRVIYDLIVAKKSFVENNPKLIRNFLTSFYSSTKSDSIIGKTAKSFLVSTKEYISWLQDAYIYPSHTEANKQYKELLSTSENIINFLSVPPQSLINTKRESIFYPRNINIKSLIHFKEE